MKEIDKKYGFVYKDGCDYGIIFGNAVYFLRDGIKDIQEEVQIRFDKNKILDGYSFGINRKVKIWKIRDTGHKNCKQIITKGRYEKGFEESLKPFLKIFK